MKFTGKVKWMATLTALAVGVTVSGAALAYPAKHSGNTNPPAVTQQADQSAAPASGAVHQPGTHNPADIQQHQSQMPGPADTSQQSSGNVPEVKVTPSTNSQTHMPDTTMEPQGSDLQSGKGVSTGSQHVHNGHDGTAHHGSATRGNHGTGGHE
ncbi:MAG: hypothetical protein ACYC4H_05655 [Desulfocucumaceae bacterium]